MQKLVASALALLFLLALFRAVAFLANAAIAVGNPLENFHLEAKFVHLTWRVSSGLELYPEYRDYPHVANFFGPLYFLFAGTIGTLTGAEIAGLFLIGRWISIVAAVATALLVAAHFGIRKDGAAAILAGLVCAGAPSAFQMSVMVRPDVLANTLGFAGFLSAVGASCFPWGIVGSLLLAAAILTKQTCGIYLVAVVIALLLRGRRRRAASVFGITAATVTAFLLAYRVVEPNVFACLLAEGKTPWDPQHAWALFLRVLRTFPELLFLPCVGIALWIANRRVEPAVLAMTLLVASAATSMKQGSDLNYYLAMRIVAALAAGELLICLRPLSMYRKTNPISGEPAKQSPRLTVVVGAGLLSFACVISLAPSALFALEQTYGFYKERTESSSPSLKTLAMEYEPLIDYASANPENLLTDAGLLALYQREHAPFVDPWLFRMLVDTGQIAPDRIRERILNGEYAAIILTAPVDDPNRSSYAFGMPATLAQPIRQRYRFAGMAARLFIYEPM